MFGGLRPGAPVENVWLTALVLTLLGMAGLLAVTTLH
jgi:hypothetical protein